MQAQEIIARLAHYQQAVGDAEGKPIGDSEFARRFLPFSGTTLSRIRSGTYGAKLDSVCEQCLQAFDEIESRLERIRRNAAIDRAFVRTTLAKAVLASVQKARDTRGRRVVVVLSPTGAGKTEIGRYLESRGAVYVEGRKSWKSSYKAFCSDVSRAAGRPVHKSASEQDAELSMLDALKSKAGILYIDEANSMAGFTADAIKLVVNQTDYTVVIAAIPEMWDDFLRRAENEVRQIINRCQPVLRYSGVSADDARAFLSGVVAPDAMAPASKSLADAANAFGAFKTIVSVCDDLRDSSPASAEDVQASVRKHAASIAASGLSIVHTK